MTADFIVSLLILSAGIYALYFGGFWLLTKIGVLPEDLRPRR